MRFDADGLNRARWSSAALTAKDHEKILEIDLGMIYYHTGGDKNGGFKNSNYIRKRHVEKA